MSEELAGWPEGTLFVEEGYSPSVLEALEGYGQYCIELAALARDDSGERLDVPSWDEYLVEYLIEELRETTKER